MSPATATRVIVACHVLSHVCHPHCSRVAVAILFVILEQEIRGRANARNELLDETMPPWYMINSSMNPDSSFTLDTAVTVNAPISSLVSYGWGLPYIAPNLLWWRYSHTDTTLAVNFSTSVMISDLALFIFLLLYDVASEVSPTWLTPVYLLSVQVAVTWLHLSLTDWTTSPLIDDSLLVRCCDSVLGDYTCTFLLFYLGI